MVHNGKKSEGENKPSLVVIRQKPRCLSSLGDDKAVHEENGNKRYKLKAQRVQTSCSAPIQEDENYDKVEQNLGTKENN